MKGLLKFLFVIILIGAALFFFRNPLIKFAVTTGAKAVVGQDLEIEKLNVDVAKSMIDIDGIQLHNPEGFVDPLMVDIQKVYVDIHTKDVLKGKIHVENIELDLKEFTVIKNKNGELNLDKLKTVAQSKGKNKEEKGPAPEISIDNMHLKIGKVVYKDYSRSKEPTVKEYVLNLDESHQNIKDLNAVAAMIVMKVVTKTTIGQLTNFDLGGLEDIVGGTLKSSSRMATKAIEETTNKLKATTSDIQKIINLPFNNNP